MNVPGEVEYLEAFGLEPEDFAPQDGYWQYSFDGPSDSRIVLAYNTHERSVTVDVFSGSENVSSIHLFDAASIWIEDRRGIHIAFEGMQAIKLFIQVLPVAKLQVSRGGI